MDYLEHFSKGWLETTERVNHDYSPYHGKEEALEMDGYSY